MESFPGKNVQHFHCKSASGPLSSVRCPWTGGRSRSIPEKEPCRHWESTQTLHLRAQLLHHPGLGWSLSPTSETALHEETDPRKNKKNIYISTGFPAKIMCINRRLCSVTSLTLLIRRNGSWWIMGTECRVIITSHFWVRGSTS